MIAMIVRGLIQLVIAAMQLAAFAGRLLATAIITLIGFAWRKYQSFRSSKPPQPPANRQRPQIPPKKRRVPQPLRPKPWL